MISSQRLLSRAAAGALRRRPAPTSSTSPGPATGTFSAPVSPASHSLYHTTTPALLSDEEGPKTKQLKVKKKVKNSAKKAEGGRDRHLDVILRALDAPVLKPPPASEEEMQRRHDIGKAYNIGTWEQHNAIHHDLNCKLRLKNHAIDMLPKDSMWKEEALKIDYFDGPPYWRGIPTWTPPIPGFDPSEFIHEDE